ncbi:MAG: restriction endonuclease subunit S [bacterium]
MCEWKKTIVGEFLFERVGRYKPNAEEIAGLKRIDKIDFLGNIYIAQNPSKTNMILIKPGDLVISGINVAKGAMGIYSGNEDVTATIHYSSYTFDKDQISLEYFKRFLRSPEFIKLLKEQVKGGIKTEIKPKHLLSLEISLPTLETQQKIVSHFQRIESEDNELKDEIVHQQALLKKLRQQVLQEAIEGKLTADFRAQNPDIEPASELLARIKAEKERLIKEGKIKKQKPLPLISEEEEPFELPERWVWCRLGDISINSLGKMLDNQKNKGILKPYLRNLNVQWYKVNIEDLKKMPFEEHETEKYSVRKGDIIICEGGYPGQAAIWNENYQIMFQKALHRVRFIFSCYISELFVHLLWLWDSNKKIHEYFTGTGIKHLTGKSLNRMIIPLPSFLEQKAIFTKVERLLTLCDQLEAQITTSKTHAEQLMQAVLKEAFSQGSEA